MRPIGKSEYREARLSISKLQQATLHSAGEKRLKIGNLINNIKNVDLSRRKLEKATVKKDGKVLDYSP